MFKYSQLKYADTKESRVPVTRGATFIDKDYNPTHWTRPNCLDIEKLPSWADHPDVKQVPQAVWNHRTRNGRFPVEFNPEGVPLNPDGPTGLAGRGLYGEWGPNESVDVLITRHAKDSSGVLRLNANGKPLMEYIGIDRSDNGKGGESSLAIPGGMAKKMLKDGCVIPENTFMTAWREFNEETGTLQEDEEVQENPADVLQQAFKEAFNLFEGKVNNDPRETDNAWGFTLVKHIADKKGIFSKVPLLTTKESKDSKWTLYDPDQPGKYFADHGKYIHMGYLRIYSEYL